MKKVKLGLKVVTISGDYNEEAEYSAQSTISEFAPEMTSLRMFLHRHKYQEVEVFVTLPDGSQKGPTKQLIGFNSDINAVAIETHVWGFAKGELEKE